MTYNSDQNQPWDDGGDEVIINTNIPSHAMGHPFEVYYYKPSSGYGYLKFNQEGIQFRVPKGGKGTGSLYWAGDLDGDADFDAGDLGCMLAFLATAGLGYLFKKARNASLQDEFGIVWSQELEHNQIAGIDINGRTLVITSNDWKRNIFKLRAAKDDGERLYKELSFHFPSALYVR